MTQNLSLIGFGEAGSTFALAGQWGAQAHVWDIAAPRRALAQAEGIQVASDAADALRSSTLALSLVTADSALPAARDYAPFLASGAIWCDMNSIAPQSKQEAARWIEEAGAHYVDVAILAPVNPARMAVPLLLSGKAATDAAHCLSTLGFSNVRVVGDTIGRASAIKMVRSVMVKGLEALTDEMMAAAHAAGVEDEVLASLDASEKSIPWKERAAYNLERMETHGGRRAAEMEEVAKTLAGFGVEPLMTTGTVTRQRAAGIRGQHTKGNRKTREGKAA